MDKKLVTSTKFLKENLWMKYIWITNNNVINPERIYSMEEKKSNHVFLYVMKTLDIFEEIKLEEKTASEKLLNYYISEALKWSEVSKCGSNRIRKTWAEKGFSLDIHNEASAEIYKLNTLDDKKTATIVYTLIKTHGLLGQYVRGEVSFSENLPLYELLIKKLITPKDLEIVLKILNECIIKAVSEDLWNDVKPEIYSLIKTLVQENLISDDDVKKRFSKLFPNLKAELTEDDEKCLCKILPYYTLWYPYVALQSFSKEEIITIFSIIKSYNIKNLNHISFYNLAQNLYYDYEGKKKVNIYKKRIISLLLKEYIENIPDKKMNEHVSFKISIENDTLFFDFKFTKVCQSLIDFCIESERSGIMTYEKNITTIFDLFGFRRDIFDRLNNEEKYLNTMNDAKCSTKIEILDYVRGNKIVDVGSGGGVMLDLLEEKFPDRNIIGTDISENVIEHLENKIKDEKHSYSVMKHNFVEGPLEQKVDTIIFSSILHEVYSYTEMDGQKFNIDSVKIALQNAEKSLNDGGQIIIRDGILVDSDESYVVNFKNKEGMTFLNNYIRDFKGLAELRYEHDNTKFSATSFSKCSENSFSANINLIREFLFTYTWGNESYQSEVQEQFGYFTLSEYKDFLTSLGLNIKIANQYMEQGYIEFLEKLVDIENLDFKDLISTVFIVVNK